MARYGPLPNPDLRLVNGGADHRPPPSPPLKPPPFKPREPRWVEVFGADKDCKRDASRCWRMIVPQLIEIHELAQLDVLSIEDCCIVFARVRQCERELNTGLTKDTDRGPAKNAATTILNQYRTSYQRYMAEFGLSSMSRKRLNPREPEIPEDDSDLDETES